jgi:hypothetical protein
MSPHLQPETLKWTLPIAVAAFFSLVGGFFTWAKDWSATARRGHLLDQGTKRVEFWSKWLDAVRVNGISVSTEQVTAAHYELTKTADVMREALRFWPLPQNWTPAEFRVRWEKLGIGRRLFMLYRQHDRRARWERLAWYAAAVGLCTAIVTRSSLVDHRPDDTAVYVYQGGGPPGVPVPMSPDGFETTLGSIRRDGRFDDYFLIFMLVGGRLVIFSREWRWMTPLRDDPEWIRTRRARFYRAIVDRSGGKVPSGTFNRDVSTSEVQAEIQWLAAKESAHGGRKEEVDS